MSEKDKITSQKVKYNGIFNFKETYQFMHRWLVDEGYDVEEQKYQEEIQGDAKKLEIKWVATKKISDYFRNEIKLKYIIVGLKSVEVEKDGKRVKSNSGTLEINFTGTLIKDYQSTWEKNPTMKFLRGVYDRYIVEGTIEKYEIKLFGDVEDLAEQMKSFLAIEGRK